MTGEEATEQKRWHVYEYGLPGEENLWATDDSLQAVLVGVPKDFSRYIEGLQSQLASLRATLEKAAIGNHRARAHQYAFVVCRSEESVEYRSVLAA